MPDDQIPEAIPGCMPWRINNTEPCDCGQYNALNPSTVSHVKIAPYCCSAYCPRCAYLRAQDGVAPLEPNEWITRA